MKEEVDAVADVGEDRDEGHLRAESEIGRDDDEVMRLDSSDKVLQDRSEARLSKCACRMLTGGMNLRVP